MTAKQLSDYLKSVPDDSTILFENTDAVPNGLYEVKSFIPYEDGTVLLCTDYKVNYGLGISEQRKDQTDKRISSEAVDDLSV